MRSKKIKGLIIQKRSFNEKDCFLTLFTPYLGKLKVTAKGARNIKSKFTGHLDLLNLCDFEIYINDRTAILTESNIQKSFPNFREDLKKFYFASLISRLLIKYTTENENHEKIFDLTMDALTSLDELDKEELIYEGFKIKLSKEMGILPDIKTIEQTEIKILNQNIKEVMEFMLHERFENISKLKLNKEDSEGLKQTTQLILEYST